MGRKRPHILVLQSSLRVGGIEKVSLALAESLRDRYRFTTVAFDDGGSLTGEFHLAGARTRVFRRRQGVDVAYPFRLARLIRREKADLVHCHNETALFYGRLAAGLARRARVVYTEHDRKFPSPSHTALLNRALAHRCDAVVTVSARLREELARHEGIRSNHVRVIRNGVDGRPFDRVSTRADVLAELGLRKDTQLVVAAGRLSREKGFDILVKAAPSVVHALPDTVFAVAGDGGEMARLTADCQTERLLFLGERNDVPRLLLASDLVVIPSRSEGLPLIAVEAAAAGKPVVASDVGALSEIVVDGGTGRLVPKESVGALIANLSALLADVPLRASMGHAARERYDGGFTIERMSGEYAEVFDRALSRTA